MCAVCKTIRNGSPARDYILISIYANQDQLHAACGKFLAGINDYVETIFSDVQKIQKTGKKMMELTAIPHHDYPER
jgi:CheY-like chemotaxis protein